LATLVEESGKERKGVDERGRKGMQRGSQAASTV